MSAQEQEAIFEAPAAHEAGWAPSPEGFAGYETGFEGETHEASHYGVPEGFASPEGYASPEDEWEMLAGEASPEWQGEGDPFLGNLLGGLFGESGELQGEASPEWQGEGEADPFLGNILGNVFGSLFGGSGELQGEASPEWQGEGEADPFFGKVFSLLGKVAKRVAPGVARAVGGLFPGGSPLAQLAGSLFREGEQEAAAMESQLFGHAEGEAEVGGSEAAHEAALTELLAHEAAESEHESEAVTHLAASLPITITIMRGRQLLRPAMPALTQANGRLVRTMRRHGRPGRQLLRTVPAIQRRTVAGLRAAARRGQPVTGPLAAQTMARAARGVLSDPWQVRRALVRNAVLRHRVAPPHPRRAQVFAPQRVAPYHPRRAGAVPQRGQRPRLLT